MQIRYPMIFSSLFFTIDSKGLCHRFLLDKFDYIAILLNYQQKGNYSNSYYLLVDANKIQRMEVKLGVNSSRLLVLGVVLLREPTYGYEIEKELKQWNAHRWAGIARASVYNQLRSLTKNGMLKFDSTIKPENRPTQYLYRITEKGKKEFNALLREQLNNADPQPGDLMLILPFIPFLSREEISNACQKRMQYYSSFTESFDNEMENWFPPETETISYK